MSARRVVGVLASCGWLLTAAPAAAQVAKCNEALTMSDGTVLRANVILPGDGQGKFPLALTATGYNKDATNPTGTQCAEGGALAAPDPALLAAGYAVMLLDDRGTGASQGQWDSWGERTQADYEEVLDWIQAQPWSNGKVGTHGGSYMGITSLLIAQADRRRIDAGRPQAVHTVWADVPMSDAYRDVTFHGGAVDAGFIPLWLGLTSSLSNVPPSTTLADPVGSAPTYAQHLANTFDFAARQIATTAIGGDSAYDGPFFELRSPGRNAHRLRVPVAWVGGWWDIFQRGEPLLYEQLVNSPRRLFFMTPNYHGAPDQAAWEALGIGTESAVKVRWFNRWLKGAEDPALDALKPVNLWTLGAQTWEHTTDWPVPGTRYTEYHLGDGTLETAPPKEAGGDDAVLLPLSSPCSRMSMQWTAGLANLGPCETDNSTFEATGLTYTTPALERDTKITGLVTADVWATLTSPEATLVAVLSDLKPDGSSEQLSAGFLLASQRAIDESRSTRSADGRIVRPFHPFTRAAQQGVPRNVPQRYRIEVYPTSNVFKAGHRIRLTIHSANTPSTLSPVPNAVAQLGGVLRVLRGPRYDSHLLLPVSGEQPAAVTSLPAAKRCLSKRTFRIRLSRGLRVRRATVTVAGKTRRARRRGGRWVATVDLRGLKPGRYVARVRAVTTSGKVVRSQRTYRTCTRR